MSFKIYHQLGFRECWNLDSINTHKTGEGIILSPKHMGLTNVEQLDFPREKTIFDPQFFVPSDSPGKLSEYPFYPNQSVEDFSTETYKPVDVQDIAQGCLKFQVESGFEFVVIPGRPYGNNPQEYITEQEKCFITPFLNQLSSFPNHQPVLLQVLIDNHYLLNPDYFHELLDWLTSLDERIEGVYLIFQIDYKTKQIEDADYLFALLKFINILTEYNDLKVVIGYCNLESLVLTISGPTIITMGSYENTRRFNIENFIDTDEKRRMQPPTPRLYMSQLLQLIDYRYKDSILEEFGNHYFDFNEYQAIMFVPDYNWHFTKPELYKHFFLVFSNQLNQLKDMTLKARYLKVKDIITLSIENFEILETLISFGKDSREDHLHMWLTAINRYAKYKGWKK
ncbi:MAG: hypothetical protein U9R53_08125 [Chloroflexota bacterium]|nr:hypothetical protein [Chloroflexota bacterium]